MTSCRYLIADYERNNFSVSQCSWNTEAKPHIMAIKPPGDSTSASSNRLSPGAIAGIAVGVAVILILLIVLGIILKRKRRPQKPKQPKQINSEVVELDSPEKYPYTVFLNDSENGYPGHAELDTVEHKGHEIDSRTCSGQELGIQERRFEMDATERHSRTLSSPISAVSERSDPPRLHKREPSDPVSVTSERLEAAKGRKSEPSEPVSPRSESSNMMSPKRKRSNATWLHERQLSDPITLTPEPVSPRSETSNGHQRESSDLTSPIKKRSDATRLHKRELSDPISLFSESPDE